MADDMLVIIPTRGRPQAIPEIMQAWRCTEATADLLFVIDNDDPAKPEYEQHWDYKSFWENNPDCAFVASLYSGPRKRLCGSLNDHAVLAASRYRFLAFMGDDHRPRTAGWDTRLRECLSGGAGIAYGNDLLMGERMPTAVAMTSDIVTTLGYMAPPSLVHLCLDLVWLDWGKGTGRITYLDDVVIEHMHPAAQKAALDQGYEECNSPEQVSSDSAAYYDYRDNGGLEADLAKLRTLIEEAA